LIASMTLLLPKSRNGMDWGQYYRLREKFKIITTETVVQTVKKDLRHLPQ
jgi:hypothetical protein